MAMYNICVIYIYTEGVMREKRKIKIILNWFSTWRDVAKRACVGAHC